jgi:hypothetical protein
MMTWHASRRPTAREMLGHEWIRAGGAGPWPAAVAPMPPLAPLFVPTAPAGAKAAPAGRPDGPAPEHELLCRLRAFAAQPPLRRAAALVVAKCLPFDELRGLQELFQSVDEDGDAAITAYELQRVGPARRCAARRARCQLARSAGCKA